MVKFVLSEKGKMGPCCKSLLVSIRVLISMRARSQKSQQNCWSFAKRNIFSFIRRSSREEYWKAAVYKQRAAARTVIVMAIAMGWIFRDPHLPYYCTTGLPNPPLAGGTTPKKVNFIN